MGRYLYLPTKQADLIAFDIFVCLAITYLITDYRFMNSIDDVYLIGRRIFLDQKK